MKIIVTQSALERLVDAIDRLQREGKTVEKIMVTPGEMDALLDCPIGPDDNDPLGQRSCFKDRELYVRGLPVAVGPIAKGDVVAEEVVVGA